MTTELTVEELDYIEKRLLGQDTGPFAQRVALVIAAARKGIECENFHRRCEIIRTIADYTYDDLQLQIYKIRDVVAEVLGPPSYPYSRPAPPASEGEKDLPTAEDVRGILAAERICEPELEHCPICRRALPMFHCDGVTDDTEALQARANIAAASEGEKDEDDPIPHLVAMDHTAEAICRDLNISPDCVPVIVQHLIGLGNEIESGVEGHADDSERGVVSGERSGTQALPLDALADYYEQNPTDGPLGSEEASNATPERPVLSDPGAACRPHLDDLRAYRLETQGHGMEKVSPDRPTGSADSLPKEPSRLSEEGK